MNPETPATTPAPAAVTPRLRTCRACGKKFEYPVKGSPVTRHHCIECVEVPVETRRVLERLTLRVTQLENALRKLQKQP